MSLAYARLRPTSWGWIVRCNQDYGGCGFNLGDLRVYDGGRWAGVPDGVASGELLFWYPCFVRPDVAGVLRADGRLAYHTKHQRTGNVHEDQGWNYVHAVRAPVEIVCWACEKARRGLLQTVSEEGRVRLAGLPRSSGIY